MKKRHISKGQNFFVVKEQRSIALPPGYIVNGEIQQPEMVRKKLLILLGKEENKFSKIKTPWVIADLPEPKTFLKLIAVETSATELTSDDILYQAKKHLPFELEEAYLDWQIVPLRNEPQENKITQILLGAVPKIISDSYTYLLESVGLKPLALEIEAQSLSRALITANKDYSGEARALLDLGATRSSIVIYDHNTLQFSSNIVFSSNLINKTLAQELNIEIEEAEKLKNALGLTAAAQNPKYLKVVADLTEELIQKIQQTLDFYKEHFAETNPISHITMCGGLAQMLGLSEAISRKLEISAEIGNAWKNLSPDKKMLDEKEKQKGLFFASAIGLALHAADNPHLEIL